MSFSSLSPSSQRTLTKVAVASIGVFAVTVIATKVKNIVKASLKPYIVQSDESVTSTINSPHRGEHDSRRSLTYPMGIPKSW